MVRSKLLFFSEMSTFYAIRMFLSCCLLPRFASAAANWTGTCKSTERSDDVISGLDLAEKVMIVLGADGNIAEQVCLSLARSNASVILACRNASTCHAAKRRINEKLGNNFVGKLEVELIDLSSKTSIAAFAQRTMNRYRKIDALINAAGTYGTFMTHDKLVGVMEINLLGPALLTNLLLPTLRRGAGRGKGRVVHVAAATYGTERLLTPNTTVADLAALCTAVDAKLNASGQYFPISKFLMTHHAIELALREPDVATFAVNPGVAVLPDGVPDWFQSGIRHFPFPSMLPKYLQHIIKACNTNEIGLDACPQTYAQAASVIVAAAAWKGIESFSGSFLDFETSQLSDAEPNVYGPFKQREPTCVPRTPPPMTGALRSDWFDEMLRLMGSGSTNIHSVHQPKDAADAAQELML
eukprot:TRINITY_DN60654_c0_g1_i1.p1 TRINITY_DN60654_c0_g1~~TRINITY_DN60654_c0_g1_i1.p1  ORF type:complete len:412 (-),score=63.81 TRINITY_DN60654_c0_g1_i1:174-1409(-)